MRKMLGNLVGSESYVWSTSNVLGKGATGAVYQGIHKFNGEAVAIKTFNHLSHMRPDHVQIREFEMLKKVNHKNIVRLLAIEQEQKQQQQQQQQGSPNNKVLVMELCTGGSLFNILDDPENTYGLKEDEFLLVMGDLSAGMKHLRDNKIVHRDLKPGNIMKYISADGRVVYKLTDFGAARELPDDQQFMSLYGTEEYLHPDMYERAVLRKSAAKGFGATVDLWSIGVTLYHLATGSLPFRPYGGRKNKETMFFITTEKKSGVLSGVQLQDNGTIEWSRTLPDTCQLSSGLQRLVTPLLGSLLESDLTKMWTFEQFFGSVTDILSHRLIHVFYVNSGKLLHVYVHPKYDLGVLQAGILEQTDVPASRQMILWKKRNLREMLSGADAAEQTFPETSPEKPILLLSDGCNEVKDVSKTPPLPKIPTFSFSSNGLLDNDASLAKIHCTIAYSLKRLIDRHVYANDKFLATAKAVLEILGKNLSSTDDKLKFLYVLIERDVQLTQTLSSCFKFYASILDVVYPNSTGVFDTSSKKLRDSAIENEEIVQTLKDHVIAIDRKMKPLHQELFMQRRNLREWKLATASSESRRLANVAATYVQKIRDCWTCLNKYRSQRTLSYNDEQFHKLEKRKLQDLTHKLSRLLQNDCMQSYRTSAENLSSILKSASSCKKDAALARGDVNTLEQRLVAHNASLEDARKDFDDKLNLILSKINEEWILRKKDTEPTDHVETSLALVKQQQLNKMFKESLHKIHEQQEEVQIEGKLAKSMVAKINELLTSSAPTFDADSKLTPNAKSYSQ